MRGRSDDAGAYMRRLAEIDADALLQVTDVLHLRSGVVLERTTLPQRSRGRRSAACSASATSTRALANPEATRWPREGAR